MKKTNDVVPVDFSAAEKDKLEAAMDYLKSVVVDSKNLNRIKAQMLETLSYRVKLMKDQKLDIKESFPFLFASVDLVKN